MTVADQLDAVVELGFRLGIVGAGVVEAGVDACQRAPDAVLLVLELVQWDRAGVVGLEELVSLRQELALLFGQVVDLHLRLGVEDSELFGDDGLERSLRRLVELDGGVVVDDELLDAIHVHGLAGAAGPFLVPAGADEVGVDHAVPVARVHKQQACPAGAAEQRALEVVGVDLCLVAGEVVRSKNGLYA